MATINSNITGEQLLKGDLTSKQILKAALKSDASFKYAIHALIKGDKGDTLTFDTTPKADSTNPVTSGGVQSAISSEASARSSADTTLQSSIDSEASARKSADATLQGNIDKKQDKLTFDSTPTSGSSNPVTSGGVYTAINSEASARSSADTTLQGHIDSEASARASADTTLQANIDTLDTTTRDYTHQLKRNTAYAVGDIAYDVDLPSYMYLECTTAGTTGSTKPDFSSVKSGGVVSDGTSAWTCKTISNKEYVDAIDAKLGNIGEIYTYSESTTVSAMNVFGLEKSFTSLVLPKGKYLIFADFLCGVGQVRIFFKDIDNSTVDMDAGHSYSSYDSDSYAKCNVCFPLTVTKDGYYPTWEFYNQFHAGGTTEFFNIKITAVRLA